MRRLRKLLALSPEERRLLVRAVLLVAWVRTLLWILPFSAVRRFLLAGDSRVIPRRWGENSHPQQTARAVARAARLVPRANCLTQALAVRALLARTQYPSQLRIGVARTARGAIEAHAWLESDGVVLIGGEGIGRYARLPALRRIR